MNITQEEYDICVYLAKSIYGKYPNEIKPTHTIRKLSGLRADIFELNDISFVVFCGTNGFFAINDWLTNIKLAFGLKPKQYYSALEFVSSELDQNKRTIFVGHSLGGFHVEAICNTIRHNNFIGIVFNGAGARHITKPKYPDNIYHLITTRDILNRVFLKWIPFRWFKRYFKHIGKVFYVEDTLWNGVKSHSNFELFEKIKIEK